MSQNGRTHNNNSAAYAAELLLCVRLFCNMRIITMLQHVLLSYYIFLYLLISYSNRTSGCQKMVTHNNNSAAFVAELLLSFLILLDRRGHTDTDKTQLLENLVMFSCLAMREFVAELLLCV